MDGAAEFGAVQRSQTVLEMLGIATERQGRITDHELARSMEDKKPDGPF